MTGTAKRLTLVVGVAALAAVVVASVIGPGLSAAPREKPSDGGSFTIRTDETWTCATSSGTFRVSGAIESSGSLWGSLCWYDYGLALRDGSGKMSIDIAPGKHGTFEVVYADGAYESLIGATGSYHDRLTTDFDASGDPFGTISRTLRGSVP